MKLEDREDVRLMIVEKISGYLQRFDPDQVGLFKRLYPEWPNKMTAKTLANAIDVCERTARKRKATPCQ